jgi:methionyl-tRNA formyltransferase
MQHKKNINIKQAYIFASCKLWHRASFDYIRKEIDADWYYVSNIDELKEVLSIIKPRYIFFLHWNWILPDSVWRGYECVCFHMTDVPYGRGGSPLQNLILAEHSRTMLSALRMVKDVDAGPVYAKKPFSLHGSAQKIYLRVAKLSLEIIKWMIKCNPQPMPQEGEVVNFNRRKPEQSYLPGNGTLLNAYDFIRMLDAEGYPNAFVVHGNYKLNFKSARLKEGKVIAEVEIKLLN